MRVWYWRLGRLEHTEEFASVEKCAESALAGEWGSVIGDDAQTLARLEETVRVLEERRDFLWHNRDDGRGPSWQQVEDMLPRAHNALADFRKDSGL